MRGPDAPPRGLIQRARGCLVSLAVILAAAAVVGLVAYQLRAPLLTWVGGWLYHADTLEPADAIVVLAGSMDRDLEAADLFVEGFGPTILLTRPPARPVVAALRSRGVDILSDIETRLNYLDALGVGRTDVTVLQQVVESPQTEALLVAEWAESREIERLIVVTSGFHTSRTPGTVREQLANSACRLADSLGAPAIVVITRTGRLGPTRAVVVSVGRAIRDGAVGRTGADRRRRLPAAPETQSPGARRPDRRRLRRGHQSWRRHRDSGPHRRLRTPTTIDGAASVISRLSSPRSRAADGIIRQTSSQLGSDHARFHGDIRIGSNGGARAHGDRGRPRRSRSTAIRRVSLRCADRRHASHGMERP